MIDFFAFIGFVFLAASAVGIIGALCYEFKEWVIRLKWAYKVKHRFDKPPTAKCYCIDCVRHNNENQKCYKFDGWRTADSWFCWDAEPRKKDDEHVE